jgi:hypothetical protein
MVLDMEEKEAEAKELLLREQAQQQAEVCYFSCALLLLVCAGAGYFSRVRGNCIIRVQERCIFGVSAS